MNPHLIPSYSQFGEDRVINGFFANQQRGVYVDVGCNHPIAYSNTWQLYLRGWRGVGIDPNPRLVEEYRRRRPNDVVVQKAVSNHDGKVDFYFSHESDLISGIGEQAAGPWKRTPQNSSIVQCECQTLETILANNNIPLDFDLLSIDVEGHELVILESIDFSCIRPRLIVVEMHDFDLMHPEIDAVYARLVSSGYQLISYLKPSGFFAAR